MAVLSGAARSGTTLLRLILDAHPEIACPAEAGIPSLTAHLARVWGTIRDPTNQQVAEMAAEIKREVRAAAMAPMATHCEAIGKRMYCDKSLDSVHQLESFHAIFPEARYVFIFRNVMDTVASGIEASPWGFNSFGYAPFVEGSVDNFVAPLVSYWLTHVEKAMQWEQTHPDLCHFVRYEDLVRRPQEIITRLCEFLGVNVDLSVLESAFDRPPSEGPGDYKVFFTSSVHSASIGRGRRVPVNLIPPQVLENLNVRLGMLGYGELDETWNAIPDARPPEEENSPAATALIELLEAAEANISHQSQADGTAFAIIAEDRPDLRWVIDVAAGSVQRGDGDVDLAVVGLAEDLVRLADPGTNLGVLMRSGRIRHVAGDEEIPYGEMMDSIREVGEILRRSSSRDIAMAE